MKKSYKQHTYCNYCKSKKISLIYKLKDQNLVKCDKCDLFFLDKQLNNLLDLYNKEYYGGESEDSNYAEYSEQAKVMKKNFNFAYKFINKLGNKKIRLLDIGSGYGFFSEHLNKNVTYEAIEISRVAVQRMRSNGINAFHGEILKSDIKKRYDIIVAFDVIEHQVYLKEFVDKVRVLLKHNGVFIITTPDFGSITNKLFRENAPTIQPKYHNYYLTQNWLKNSLPSLGFKIEELKTVHLTFLSVAQVLLLASFALPFLRYSQTIRLVRFFNLHNKIVPSFRFGGIICIAKKI